MRRIEIASSKCSCWVRTNCTASAVSFGLIAMLGPVHARTESVTQRAPSTSPRLALHAASVRLRGERVGDRAAPRGASVIMPQASGCESARTHVRPGLALSSWAVLRRELIFIQLTSTALRLRTTVRARGGRSYSGVAERYHFWGLFSSPSTSTYQWARIPNTLPYSL